MEGKIKIAGGVMGAIIIGAVGSGLWEYVFSPALASSGRAVLNLATLGMESFKNDLYRQVASGLHEQASIDLYVRVKSILGLLLILAPIFLTFVTKQLSDKRIELLKELDRIESGTERKVRSVQELRESLLNTKIQWLSYSLYVLIALTIVFFVADYVSTKRDVYVNSAITYFNQSKKIIAPFVDDTNLRRLDSQFAQIQSPSDYRAIMQQMQRIADKNGVNLPKFEIW